MRYYHLCNEELVPVDVESLPEEVELQYQEIRKVYVIHYDRSDWAEDDRDAGMGYDYNNSYEVYREPQRRELVFEEDKLAGFYVGYSDDVRLESTPTKKYFLPLKHEAKIYERGSYSSFYGNSKNWALLVKDEPADMDAVCLMRVEQEEKMHLFTLEEFDPMLVSAVLKQCSWEDCHGQFDGTYRVTLRLTEKAMMQPDAVLKAFSAYRPVLVCAMEEK